MFNGASAGFSNGERSLSGPDGSPGTLVGSDGTTGPVGAAACARRLVRGAASAIPVAMPADCSSSRRVSDALSLSEFVTRLEYRRRTSLDRCPRVQPNPLRGIVLDDRRCWSRRAAYLGVR